MATGVWLQYGDTALHTATRYGHAGVASILLNARAPVNLQNTVNITSSVVVCAASSTHTWDFSWPALTL